MRRGNELIRELKRDITALAKLSTNKTVGAVTYTYTHTLKDSATMTK